VRLHKSPSAVYKEEGPERVWGSSYRRENGTLEDVTVTTDSANVADVIVIGGGIIGSTIALRLAPSGLKVSVFDRGEPGGEASSAAAGMIAPFGEKIEPGPFFDLCLASYRLYPDFVQEIEELSGSRVDYRRNGTLLLAVSEGERQELEMIAAAQQKLGLANERLASEAARQRVPSLSPAVRLGLFLPGDHCVDSELLTRAVIGAAKRRRNVSFFSQSPVRSLSIRKGRVESVEVGADHIGTGTTFSAGQFILAAGCWSAELVTPLGIELHTQPCRGQMMEFDCAAELPFVLRAGRHYLVPRDGGRVVAGTTLEYTGYEKTVSGGGLRSILEGAERILPDVRDFKFRRAWAGLRPDTADHLPILGHGELPNLIFATGHFRNGILLAPVTAKLVSELVLSGSTSVPLEAFQPTRLAAHSA
jgi:glycine oxidase